jgi:hypothetical protein
MMAANYGCGAVASFHGAGAAAVFFFPVASNCLRKATMSSTCFGSFRPGKTILVPGILAFGSLMYSRKVASSQVMPEFLFAGE